MKKLIPGCLILIGLISCNSKIEGEGTATAEQEIAVDFFRELNIGCNCDVTLIPSENTKVVVESHQNLIDNLKINPKKKKLEISENKEVGDYSLYNVNVYFSPGLSKVKLSAQSRMKFSGTFKTDKMNFELRDNSDISDTYVEIDQLQLELKDNASARIRGTAVQLELDASDNSVADLSELQSVDINFKTSDNAGSFVYPMKNLTGKASDNSSVKYMGDPVKNTTAKDKAIIEKN